MLIRVLLSLACATAALSSGCYRWEHDTFDSKTVRIPWYTPGDNPRLTITVEDGVLHMVDAGTQRGDLLFPTKPWQADPQKGAVVEARIKVVDCQGACGVMLMVADGVHEDALTLYKDKIRLDQAKLEYAANTTDDFHVYRIEIRKTDIRVFMDGKQVIDGRGKFASPAYGARNCFGYGAGSSNATGEAYWDWIRWTTYKEPLVVPPVVRDTEQVIVFKKEGVYACFPSLAMDPETGFLYTSFGTRVKQTHIDPTGGSACMESRDGGRSWNAIERIPPTAVPERPPGPFKTPDGALVDIGFYFWRRYPEAQRAELEKKYFVHVNSGPGPGMVATCTGGFIRRSTDGGKTWEKKDLPELDVHMSASSGWSRVQLPDGSILRAFMVKKSAKEPCDGYAVRTTDGKTYELALAIADPDRKADITEENWLHVMENGNVWMLARTEKSDDHLWQAFSEDGGRTWRSVKTGIKGHPPSSLIRLHDGRLLLTYGYRHPPFGIRAVVSEDDGKTWRTDRVFVLRTDGDNFDLGYPRSVQIKDGTIVTVYYFVTGDYITHIACTRWRAPKF